MKNKPKPACCRFCGTPLTHYGDFCSHQCKQEWEEGRADYLYEMAKDRELDDEHRDE